MDTLTQAHINRIYNQLTSYLTETNLHSLIMGSPEWEKEITYGSDENISQVIIKKDAIRFKKEFIYTLTSYIERIAYYISEDSGSTYDFVGIEVYNYTEDGDLSSTEWYDDVYNDIAQTPSVTSPVEGSFNVLLPTIIGSSPSPTFLSEHRLYREFQLDAADTTTTDFVTPLQQAQINENSWTIDDSLDISSEYKVRIRDVYESGATSWSDEITFQINSNYAETPTIVVSGEPSSIDIQPSLTGSEYSLYSSDTEDSHELTDWKIIKSSNNELVWESLEDTVNLETIDLPDGTLEVDTVYKFMVRYKSILYGYSDWGYSVLKVANIYIEEPVLTVEGSATGVPKYPTLDATAFAVYNDTDTHISTDWKIVRTSDGTVVWNDLGNTVDLISIQVISNVLQENVEYNFMVRYNGEIYGSSEWCEVITTTSTTFFNYGPGDDYVDMVAAGNYDETTDTGYMGITDAAIYGMPVYSDIISELGITGTVTYADDEWLKFYVGENADCNIYSRLGETPQPYILFVAKKPVLTNINWDTIYNAGAVFGTDTNGPTSTGDSWGSGDVNQNVSLTVSGHSYNIRLLTGAEANPSIAENGNNSEWNDLVYRIHANTPADQVGDNWVGLSNSDIIVNSGDGRDTWVQEVRDSNNVQRISRGNSGVSTFNTINSNDVNSSYGFRPCLVLIQS